jgi:hypothetical protein
MVKAIINISNEANMVLNIIKAKHGLRDKSEAINLVAGEYGQELLEPELRPEFINKMQEVKKQKAILVGDISDLKKRYS